MGGKARCVHGAQWFVVCPWCKSEAEDAAYAQDNPSLYPFWRNMTPEDVQRHIDRSASYLLVKRLMDRALE